MIAKSEWVIWTREGESLDDKRFVSREDAFKYLYEQARYWGDVDWIRSLQVVEVEGTVE